MHTQKELQRKKIVDLRRIASELGIEYDKRWIRSKLVKEILNKTESALEPANPSVQQPANPEFERAAAEKAAEPVKDNRGGAREGAGRPLGLTDEKAKVRNLPQFPSNPIRQGICSLFDLWATAAKIEELALSEDEADMESLPLTQLQEYYFPNILPEIAGSWIMLIFATTRIMKPRIKLINKVRAERQAAKQNKPRENVRPSMITHFIDKNGEYLHVIDMNDLDNTVSQHIEKVTCPTCLKLKLIADKHLN